MAVIVPGGENTPLFRFLRHNLPAGFFERGPVFCFSAESSPLLPEDTVYLADSTDLPAGPQPHRIITCGRSPKDTFTFSSREEGRGSVALMRTVTTPFGTVEPMEIPVRFPPGTSDIAVLGASAVLMLSGSAAKEQVCFSLPDMDSPLQTDGQKSE